MKKITSNQPNTRAAFTLLELLAVITIISILLALILPAISGVMRNARVAQVRAEITRLETAISSFKAEFGIEPWSEIIVTEDPGTTAWSAASRTKLRRLFPQFTFSGQIDFNGDGAFDGDTSGNDATLSTGEIRLTASECLTFFLGGMRTAGTTLPETSLIGFSKNPLAPFSRAGSNRTTTFYEFQTDRFIDADGDGMLEYLDPTEGQSKPYHFASSNNGQGYSSSTSYYVDGTGKPWKRDSHQIISPGEDGEFGPTSATPPIYTDGMDLTGTRLTEADNITNFADGRLD